MTIGRVPRSFRSSPLLPAFPPLSTAFPFVAEHVSPIRDISAVPRAISRQVAPISHIILSVCVARVSPDPSFPLRSRAERAHLILKGFMRHFPFILTTNVLEARRWVGLSEWRMKILARCRWWNFRLTEFATLRGGDGECGGAYARLKGFPFSPGPTPLPLNFRKLLLWALSLPLLRWFSLRPGIIWVLFRKAFRKRPPFRSVWKCRRLWKPQVCVCVGGVHFWQIWKLLCKMNNLVESVKLIWPFPLTYQTCSLADDGDDGHVGRAFPAPRIYHILTSKTSKVRIMPVYR